MCLSPGILATGEEVGCRKCWQCKELRINDWVGRNIAESKTAKASNFVTLTYGNDPRLHSVDHERAAVLTYSDVQKFVKKLRKAGHKLRYFAIGEYGSLKGRAHWHVLIYWLNNPPKFTLDVRENSPFWSDKNSTPLGWVMWQKVTPSAVRYACKYIQKDIGDIERQGHIAMSKKPPLGTQYFEELAGRYVEQGLAPQKLTYGWADILDREGKKIPFMMRGVVAETFALSFERQWKERYGEKSHSPHSQAITDILDRICRREDDGSWELYKAGMPWLKPPPGADEMRMHAMFGKWYVIAEGETFFWSYNEKGERAWIAENANGSASDGNAEKLQS